MKIIEMQKVNQEIATELVSIFNHLADENTEELVVQCNELLKSTKQVPYIETVGLKRFFESDPVFQKFSAGKYSCKTHGVEAGMAVALYVGLGMNVGTCLSSTGRRFALVAPELSLGFGGGAFVVFERTEFTLKQGETMHGEDGITVVSGVGFVRTSPYQGNDETHGFGIGGAYALKKGTTINLKLLPLGRNYQYLLTQLEGMKYEKINF